MNMPPLRFVYEANLIGRSNVVCVDGAFAAKLQLSHWPGNSSPEELKAETSAEMAFRLLDHPKAADYLSGIEVVSNNHFDADGIIAVFILLFPEAAHAMRQQLINIARTADFNEFTNEDALKSAEIIEEFGRRFHIPGADMQQLFEESLRLLPAFVARPDDYEAYWSKNFAWFVEGEQSFTRQEAVFSNYGDSRVSVLESPAPLHPVVIGKYAAYERLLTAQKFSGGTAFRVTYAVKTWFDIGKPQPVTRMPLEPLAKKLNLMETARGVSWKIAGTAPMYDFDYAVYAAGTNGEPAASALQLYQVEDAVIDFFIS